MPSPGQESDHRAAFAERFALLYAAAGDPPLKRVAESVARARRVDEMGRPTRVSVQRISDWRRGRNVPARFSALAATLEILIGEARKARTAPLVDGLYDLDTWRALWEQAQSSPVASGEMPDEPSVDVDSGVCPYRGLASFRQEDSDWFFGRERSTAALLARLDDTCETGGIIMLVGASGSGKSSVLQAGVGATLASAIFMTPGANPVKELLLHIPGLADVLTTAANEEQEPENFAELIRHGIAGKGERLVLIVDQFEETFTLCRDEQHRQLFVHALRAACTPGDAGSPPALVVLGVRADFYGQCLDYPELAEALQDRQMVLGAMAATELREAITRPARAVGVQLETGLVDLLMRDLGASTRTRGGSYDAGALPLLSHALLATWQRRQAGKLTIAGYRAAGGIHGAVAATAEQAWAELTSAAKSATPEVMLRLVHVGRDTRDTRRRSTRDEIVERSADPNAAAEALEALARARLVTLDADSVEISHEALLQAWPRLRSWIDNDRAGNLARQRLEEDAETWDTERRDPSLLYRGARLETALLRAKRPTGIAKDFLAASAKQRQRATWTRRVAVTLVCVLAIVAVVAAAIAITERNDAEFRRILAEADRLAEADPSLSAQLNLVAHRIRPDDQEVYSRLISTQNTPLATPILGHTGPVYETSWRPDGQILATASDDKTVRLWDMRDPSRPVALGQPLTGHTSWVTSAVFRPDGKLLATAGNDNVVRLWDVSDPAHPTALGQPLSGDNGTIYSVAFTEDGKTIATANDDQTVRLWDISDPVKPRPLGQPLVGHTAPVRSVEFSPDGRTLASAGNDKGVRLWDVTDLEQPASLGQLTGNTDIVHSVTFSPNGRMLATAGEDKTVRLWNVTDRAHAVPQSQPITMHSAAVWQVAFSPDSRMLASASTDNTTRLWNLSAPSDPVPFGPPLSAGSSGVNTVEFSPDGRTLAAGTDSSAVSLWSIPSTILAGHTYWVSSLEFSKDGRLLATASGDKTARLWDMTDPVHPRSFGPPLEGHDTYLNNLALSPDGRILATAGGDQKVRLWNVSDPAHPQPMGTPLALSTRFGGQVAFSPDGRILATLNGDSTVTFWDTQGQVTRLGDLRTGHTDYINDLAFLPNQRILATTSADKTLKLWNVDDPAAPRPLGNVVTAHSGAVHSATVSPDGKIIATTSADKTVRLWNVADPMNPTLLGNPLTAHTESVISAAFSPDGRTLATTSADKSIRLWDISDAANARPIGMLSGRMDTGYTAAFSPTARVLVTGTGDNLIRIWDLDREHAIQRICTTTRDVLTPEVWEHHLSQLTYKPPCQPS
ncbi:hypothetical protein LWC34_50315 [Kibdelosporangium philippinense]|uniref:Novel STAND NTPase 1 domain-containing protein n=1 Tax=Kibdelosporangium philippinense TaxID=211113 RepID=A0ABS8ZY45_9PSEU|nr:hypothetical protein [Kibdelosporangium philippinense]MCE7010947.1 hypothetical protein [Kibdelosporangium philippinense]